MPITIALTRAFTSIHLGGCGLQVDTRVSYSHSKRFRLYNVFSIYDHEHYPDATQSMQLPRYEPVKGGMDAQHACASSVTGHTVALSRVAAPRTSFYPQSKQETNGSSRAATINAATKLLHLQRYQGFAYRKQGGHLPDLDGVPSG